jgi:hypothetical protein
MEADWSVALAADDPVIAVPWAAFVDLRLNQDFIDEIAEAKLNPPLRSALLALNSIGSPLWTAKCDVWTTCDEPYDPYEMEAEPGETAFGAGSYIDLLARDLETRESFALQEEWLRWLTGRLREVTASAARVDMVMRHAYVEGRSGFGVSWFVEGCGVTPKRAEQSWVNALGLALAVIMQSLRSDAG